MSDGRKSAFVPGFQYDVFISYAWVNNYPEQDGKPETGWVSQFKTKLQQRSFPAVTTMRHRVPVARRGATGLFLLGR